MPPSAANARAHEPSAWPQIQRAGGQGGGRIGKQARQVRGPGVSCLPRERVARLLDRDSWLSGAVSALAGLGMHDDDGKKAVLGGGSIVGIGVVAGKRVMISASDSAIKGGTVAPMGLKKAPARPRAIALREQAAADLRWWRAGGANLMYQSRKVCGWRAQLCQPSAALGGGHPADRRGAWFSPRRAVRICRACRTTWCWSRNAQAFTWQARRWSRPRLARTSSDEDTGRQRQMHAQRHRPGRLPVRERRARDSGCPRGDGGTCRGTEHQRPQAQTIPRKSALVPRCSSAKPRFEELLGVVPQDEREPYDAREIIARVVDGSDFLEFKAEYSPSTHVCGHARIEGHARRHHRQQRPYPAHGLDQGRAVHPTVRPERHAAGLFAEHHRLYGGQGTPSAPAPSSTAPR